MNYILPLEDRLALAAKQKRQYWNDPAFRLRCINRDRAKRGAPPIDSLDQLGGRMRDAKGRWA